MTHIDLEAEYNNRERVPEHPQLIEAWQQQAEAYRQSRDDAILDQPYGPAPRNTYDYFPAAGQNTQRQTAVFIHGGYWQALDKSFFSHMAAGLNAHGFDVAIANYSLCPAVSIENIIAEMRSLAEHLFRAFGKPLLAYGHSAGGHLTAALMATDWPSDDLPENLIAAAMPISGLFDLPPLVSTTVNNALGLTDETAQAASPITWKKPAGGVYQAVVGGDESAEYLRQSRDLTQSWQTDRLQGELVIVPGANHFTVINPLSDPQSSLVQALVQLGQKA